MLLIQMTGLSGAGKSTLATAAKLQLQREAIDVKVIDGDEYRKTICADLGFSKEDRCENIRRLGKAAAAFCREGSVAIIAAINPYQQIREELIKMYDAKTVFIHCPLPVLIERDTKGLYKRALQEKNSPGSIANLTGVNDTYEAPAYPDLLLNTAILTTAQAADQLTEFVKQQLLILHT
jgi:adenylylsulfate kinase